MDKKLQKDLNNFQKKTTEVIKTMAKAYHVRLNRKLPNINKVVPKGMGELIRETESRIKNYANSPPKDRCYKPTIAINEKHKHFGKPCKPNEERTKNFCLKKLAKVDLNKVKWERTLVPNKNTRITIVCPK